MTHLARTIWAIVLGGGKTGVPRAEDVLDYPQLAADRGEDTATAIEIMREAMRSE